MNRLYALRYEQDNVDPDEEVKFLRAQVEALRRRVRELELSNLLAGFGVKVSER